MSPYNSQFRRASVYRIISFVFKFIFMTEDNQLTDQTGRLSLWIPVVIPSNRNSDILFEFTAGYNQKFYNTGNDMTFCSVGSPYTANCLLALWFFFVRFCL